MAAMISNSKSVEMLILIMWRNQLTTEAFLGQWSNVKQYSYSITRCLLLKYPASLRQNKYLGGLFCFHSVLIKDCSEQPCWAMVLEVYISVVCTISLSGGQHANILHRGCVPCWVFCCLSLLNQVLHQSHAFHHISLASRDLTEVCQPWIKMAGTH